ncbi:SGNH/GDSL hydrolase family protein [Microbacterium sp. MPKO10]|uniref:SGNH/GDSL hydrolase family protein n=1 Tax=Microbacterium sp. MPKO10 TaxID=2989818 RepID=UPI00223575DA|nr:SGNH/GDSL hydrolase family protein [Microbacterium sp. MPKO10]MCW4457202.1 lipase [Microbacterium sp. MPKO10]
MTTADHTTTAPISTPIAAPLVHGAHALEPGTHGLRPHRLPAWARRQAADPQLYMVEAQPSGVRLVFDTVATNITLEASATRFGYRGVPARPHGIFDLTVNGALTASASLTWATVVTIDMQTGERSVDESTPERIRFEGLTKGEKRVEIWLPHNETVDLVALHTNSPVRAVTDERPVWLHHGSSISHGSNATHPTGIWPVIAAQALDLNLVNLGLGGSALLDPFIARTIRDAPADLISVKLGINIANADLMRMRAFRAAVHGFLDTIRDGHPSTPLLVVSSVAAPIQENTPGPISFDLEALASGDMQYRALGDPAEVAAGKLTLTVIRETLASIVAERSIDDPNLRYINGLDLYGLEDSDEHPLLDNLHPDAATHRLIGERFATLGWPN